MTLLLAHSAVAAALLVSFAGVCVSDYREGHAVPLRDVVLGVTFAATWEVSMLVPMAVVPWCGAVVGSLGRGDK